MKWEPGTFADLEQGDFYKVGGTVFKVTAIRGETFTVVSENGKPQTGKPPQSGKIEIRTELNGKPTPAGLRLNSGSGIPEVDALLREKLDAELIAWKTVPEHEGKRFVPWTTEEFGPKADTKSLASHLFICHGIETASGLKTMKELGPKKFAEQRASLLEAHSEAHRLDDCERYDAPRRLPHVHHGAGK